MTLYVELIPGNKKNIEFYKVLPNQKLVVRGTCIKLNPDNTGLIQKGKNIRKIGKDDYGTITLRNGDMFAFSNGNNYLPNHTSISSKT